MSCNFLSGFALSTTILPLSCVLLSNYYKLIVNENTEPSQYDLTLIMRFNGVTPFKFFLHLFTLFTHLQAYTTVNHFTISCGTTGTSYDGGRTWTGDTGSVFFSNQDNTVSANPTTPQPNSTLQVPYNTARLSRSQFNYSFPVTPGSYFLRLFFYPASYPSFSRTQASFTVHCNHFTLYSFNADEEDSETVFREYVVNVHNSETLNLSFTPSQPNSHALINGIEVFSIPNDLYYRTACITKRSPKLTWDFPVDSGFYYLVSLHFCKLHQNITNIADRVFCIYIGSDLAEDHAEVMRWSNQGKGLAVQTNFVLLIPKKDTQEKVSLSLQLHPYLNSSNPCLNGVEIFKISDSDNLARPNVQNGLASEREGRSYQS